MVADERASALAGGSADLRPFTTGYSRVEEHWDVVLQPDGSARASITIRREQHLVAERNWRFVARRGDPQARARRARIGLATACTAMIAAGATLWTVWTRPVAPPPVILALPAPVVSPPVQQPPAANAPALAAASKPTTARSPVPLIFPLERPASLSHTPEKAAAPLAEVPLDARPAVRAAIARAFASGEAEAWRDETLTGFVVVGPAETAATGICRNTVILARGGTDGDRTISRLRCEAADGSIAATSTP
ncbi:hypothetical protein ACFB49_03610 [Sphingomonas sp. DBB INV C78]